MDNKLKYIALNQIKMGKYLHIQNKPTMIGSLKFKPTECTNANI